MPGNWYNGAKKFDGGELSMAQTLDTALLRAHDPEQHASLTVGAVAIVGGVMPEFGRLKKLVMERVRQTPRCTQVLRSSAAGQEWVADPDFDLARHLHRAVIPRPGDDAELSRTIARACEHPLDPDRPPWECWIIEGLRGNRWAILMKTHHGLLDGNSAAQLLTRLCDDADGNAFANDAAAQRRWPAPHERPGWVGALWRASSLAGAVTDRAIGAVIGGFVAGPGAGGRAASADPAAARRRYGTVRVPIADVDSVCRKFGVTANDVALAAVTDGFRTALIGRGEEPRADSLRTLAPMPVRSALLSYLPVEHDDPVLRLRTVHTRRQAERAGEPASGGLVESAINVLPPVVRGGVLQLLSRLPQRGIVTLATSAAGPRRRLLLMGQTLERLLPIPPTAVRLSTGVAVLSYGDELVFGVTAEGDRHHGGAFDVGQLAAGIELGMARLVALSHDSVVLFGDRRRRRARPAPGRAPHPFPPGQARH